MAPQEGSWLEVYSTGTLVVLVLVLEALQYSDSAHQSSNRHQKTLVTIELRFGSTPNSNVPLDPIPSEGIEPKQLRQMTKQPLNATLDRRLQMIDLDPVDPSLLRQNFERFCQLKRRNQPKPVRRCRRGYLAG